MATGHQGAADPEAPGRRRPQETGLPPTPRRPDAAYCKTPGRQRTQDTVPPPTSSHRVATNSETPGRRRPNPKTPGLSRCHPRPVSRPCPRPPDPVLAPLRSCADAFLRPRHPHSRPCCCQLRDAVPPPTPRRRGTADPEMPWRHHPRDVEPPPSPRRRAAAIPKMLWRH